MQVLLTGDLGFSADAEEVFGELDTKLLLATVLLVLVLLGAIYRSVLVALTRCSSSSSPTRSRRASSTSTPSAARPSPPTGPAILVVLMFGVGTDYCLLLVSRYREELRRLEDKHDAMAARRAARRPGDPRQRADGLPRDARAGPRRRAQHEHARARGRDRRRLGDGRRADAAAGAADDLRPRGFWPRRRRRRLRPGAATPASRAGSGGGSATASCSARGRAWSSPCSSSSPARSACSPTRSTTRRRRSSRSRSRASRASSCSSSRSRPGSLPRRRRSSSARTGRSRRSEVAQAVGTPARPWTGVGRRRPRPGAVSSDGERSPSLDVILEGDPYTKSAPGGRSRRCATSVEDVGAGVDRR